VQESHPTSFGSNQARRFYDWFGRWQDAQFYEKTALADLADRSDFEHASAILELGCGTGKFAETLFRTRLRPDATYVGIDVSATMVHIARQRLATWTDRATVHQADASGRLPYDEASFDRVLTTYVLDLLPRPAIQELLIETRRVLCPDGKLCIASLTEGITPASRVVASIWKRLHAFDPRLVGGCRPLRASSFLGSGAWKVEHTHVVCSWGICSEIAIASPSVTRTSA
jgi:ubiquinone/menaquinone biosynthesis C-methylase UbiE